MFDRMRDAVRALREAVDAVDLRVLDGGHAVELVELSTEAERICAAVRTLAARRGEESKVWQRDGHRNAAQWVANATGTSVGQAIGMLETARKLEELPETREAFSSGRLSEIQAREIGSAAVDRRTERALIESARTQTLSALREECRKVRAAAVTDEAAEYERIRRSRYLRHWSDPDGAVRLDARLAPDAGAMVIAAIRARQDRIFADARRTGRRESSHAYAADALVELAAGDGKAPRAMVHVLVDHKTYATGRAAADSLCEIPGIGRIPAATARALAGDAIIKALVTKGADVQAVTHVGRAIPAHIRTALEVRDPTCVVPKCHVRHGLEIDHYRIPYADGGPTELGNLARLCGWHHYLKTSCGYRLTGEPGDWNWRAPADIEGARPPPDP
jgi:uncharacterized protein DUF222